MDETLWELFWTTGLPEAYALAKGADGAGPLSPPAGPLSSPAGPLSLPGRPLSSPAGPLSPPVGPLIR